MIVFCLFFFCFFLFVCLFWTGGVFVVLLCGLAFAIVIAIAEFCYNAKYNSASEQVGHCNER